jgi:hypothetical protein
MVGNLTLGEFSSKRCQKTVLSARIANLWLQRRYMQEHAAFRNWAE